MIQTEISVNNESFDLMELCQMGIIQSFIPEDSINWEKFSWSERLLFSNRLQNSWWDCCSVGSQKVFISFLRVPFIVVTQTAIASFFVNILYLFKILFVLDSGLFGLTDKESVMGISCRMCLRLEKSIKIPERRLNISVSFHFLESHLSQDLNKLLFSFHQNMKVTIFDFGTFWVRIELFEMSLFPRPICDHWAGEVSD